MGRSAIQIALHEAFVSAMRRFQGQTLRTADIQREFREVAGHLPNATHAQPSDHCDTTNDGECLCAHTEQAIFKKVRHGYYLVLVREHAGQLVSTHC